MLLIAIVLALAGIGLIVGAPAVARILQGPSRDRIALTRILQAIGAIFLVVALFAAPYNPDNTAVPPPPEGPDPRAR